jgi:hypothetical protein
VDHETLAVVIAESWSLPAQLCDVVTATYRTAEQLEGLRDAGSDTELASLARSSLFVAHYSGFPLFGGLRLGEPPADVAALLAQVDRDALVARARSAVGAASEISRPLARTSKQGFESMRRTQDELRERLFVAEHRLRAEVAVNHVLNYGLNRLGDGDPIPGVMFQAMTSMDFSRMCAMEIDSAAAKLEVRHSVAASGQAKVSEGVWLPFPTDRAYLSEPTIVTRNDAARTSSCWNSSAFRAPWWGRCASSPRASVCCSSATEGARDARLWRAKNAAWASSPSNSRCSCGTKSSPRKRNAWRRSIR